jgi:hypothetical protein
MVAVAVKSCPQLLGCERAPAGANRNIRSVSAGTTNRTTGKKPPTTAGLVREPATVRDLTQSTYWCVPRSRSQSAVRDVLPFRFRMVFPSVTGFGHGRFGAVDLMIGPLQKGRPFHLPARFFTGFFSTARQKDRIFPISPASLPATRFCSCG